MAGVSRLSLRLLLLLLPFFAATCLVQPSTASQLAGSQTSSSSSYYEDCLPRPGLLPCQEVTAANSLLNSMGASSLQEPVSRNHCNGPDLQVFVRFECNCEYDSPQCHIFQITTGTVKLSGTISEDVSNFTYLLHLDLSYNALSGSIPDSLGNLSILQSLSLQNNQLTGEIPPSLGRLTNLIYLDLGFNYLNGTITHALGKLSSLQRLYLRFNDLCGEIPHQLGNLKNLTALALTENQFNGSLPESLGNLVNLQGLWLTSNKFTGKIPESYERLRSLEKFDVAGNNLKGSIPSFISKWPNLSDLILYGNEFDEIPPEIFNMTNLKILIITDVRRKDAPLPKSINLPNIVSIVLRNCSINGQISSIWDLKYLAYLDLSFNRLKGDIPSSLWNKSLKMELTENQLGGKINVPTRLKPDNYTFSGDFTYNNFSTEENVNSIYFKPSRTTIDEEMKKCPKMKSKRPYSLFINCGGSEEDINGRRYQAENSTSNFSVSKGWAYSCAGVFPTKVANSSDFVQTKTCAAPVTNAPLYTKSRQCPTSLRYYAFCLRKGKYNVTLHFIETVFVDRADYTILGKRIFDVYVQGNLVLKDFNIRENASRSTNVSIVSFHDTHVDGSGLLKIHFLWAGKGSYTKPTDSNGPLVAAIAVTPQFHVGLRRWQIAVIATSSALFLLFLLVFVLWWIGLIGDKKLREKSIDIRGKPYTVKQVVQGTKKFSREAEIAEDNFGTLYKSELPNGGPVVAVKKLSSQSRQKKQQVESEVYTLKQLKHDNVVELFGGYSDPTKNLNLLVYEHMERKSIAHALFGDPNSELQLDWASRYNICIGMAKGLEYLHNSRLKIVHRNINSSNILLDANLKAKISDLGLAKLFEEENPYSSIGSTGLLYRAPEYATRNEITDKADVYSFGIVLLEIVSGKSNVDYKDAQEAEFLLDKAFVLESKGRLIDLVDRKLNQIYNRAQAMKVLKLAMMCVDQSHKLRPSMSQVVCVLEDQITIEQLAKEINPSA